MSACILCPGSPSSGWLWRMKFRCLGLNADQHDLSLQTQDQRPARWHQPPPAGQSRLASTTSPAWPQPPAHPPHLLMALEHRRHLGHHPRPHPCPRAHSVCAAAATAQSTCWRLRLEPPKSPRRPRWAALVQWRTSTPFTSSCAHYPPVPCSSQQAKNTCGLSRPTTAWPAHDGQATPSSGWRQLTMLYQAQDSWPASNT